MPAIQLTDRTVILAAGPDARSFLQNIVTTDISALAEGEVRPGALLSPQGKIVFDFVISRAGEDTFRLDCRRDIAEAFLKRLMLYRLRAKVELSLREEALIAVSWDNDSTASQNDSTLLDRRFPEILGVLRHYGKAVAEECDIGLWHRLRIEHGVAEGGWDYAFGDAFPHDVLFDQNGGVGLAKGCYVGQEVVSRMHHRGTARRRLVIVEGEAPLPAPGMEVTAEGRTIGALGSVSDRIGLAIVRIDRAAEANAAGTPILAGGVKLSLRLPAYARFSLTESGGKEGTA